MRNKKSERGQSVVETALVLLVFLSMVLGIMDFGQVLYFHQSLVERARAAARYGAIQPLPFSTDAVKNMAVYNQTTTGTTPVLGGMTTSMVDVQNPGINTPEARVVVTITGYPMIMFSPFFSASFQNRAITVAIGSETQVP